MAVDHCSLSFFTGFRRLLLQMVLQDLWLEVAIGVATSLLIWVCRGAGLVRAVSSVLKPLHDLKRKFSVAATSSMRHTDASTPTRQSVSLGQPEKTSLRLASTGSTQVQSPESSRLSSMCLAKMIRLSVDISPAALRKATSGAQHPWGRALLSDLGSSLSQAGSNCSATCIP